MKPGKIDQMSGVMRALYDREYQILAPILADEIAIRGKLTRLASQVARNRQSQAGNHLQQAVGVQLLWQGWATRTHRQLNTELAQITAKKMAAMDKVRAAFGRQHAVDLMISASRRATKASRAKRLCNP